MTRIPRNFAPAAPKLSDALKYLRERCDTSCARIGWLFGRSEDTGSRMARDGDWDDLFADINHALRKGTPEERAALRAVLLANVPADDGAELSTDFNGDGRVDTQDGVDGAMANAERSMAVLRGLMAAKGESQRLYSGSRAAEITGEVDRQIRELNRIKALVAQLTASPRS